MGRCLIHSLSLHVFVNRASKTKKIQRKMVLHKRSGGEGLGKQIPKEGKCVE